MSLWVKLSRFGFLAALLLTLFYAFKPPSGAGGGLFPWDKADHFSAFFALTALGLLAFPKLSLFRLSAGMAALGAGIELVQGLPFVHRDMEFFDWVAELAAIAGVTGVVIAARWRRQALSD